MPEYPSGGQFSCTFTPLSFLGNNELSNGVVGLLTMASTPLNRAADPAFEMLKGKSTPLGTFNVSPLRKTAPPIVITYRPLISSNGNLCANGSGAYVPTTQTGAPSGRAHASCGGKMAMSAILTYKRRFRNMLRYFDDYSCISNMVRCVCVTSFRPAVRRNLSTSLNL